MRPATPPLPRPRQGWEQVERVLSIGALAFVADFFMGYHRKMTDSYHRTIVVSLFLVVGLLLFGGRVSAAGRVFYDSFEDGTTNAWQQGDSRNRCQVVTSPGDGGVGPVSGTKMVRCNFNGTLAWDDPARFETLLISPSIGNEYFLRLYIRTSPNLESTGSGGDGTGPKLLRFFSSYAAYLQQWEVNPGTSPVTLAWEDESSSHTQYSLGNISRTSWTKFETYFNKSTDLHRIWIDDVLQRDTTAQDISAFDGILYLTSNWSGSEGTRIHDSVNYMFFDEVEIFTNTGSGGTGSLSAGSITQGGGDTTPPAAPTGLGVN